MPGTAVADRDLFSRHEGPVKFGGALVMLSEYFVEFSASICS